MVSTDTWQPTRRDFLGLALVTLVTLGCGSPGGGGAVDDELSAQLAYLGLDRAIDRAIQLGFDGFNAAISANIPEQSQSGDAGGRMIVGGQVDAGASNNKEMRLQVTLESDYADVILEGDRMVYYNGGPAQLDMSLKDLPNAELTGTFVGEFAMDGDLVGIVALNLQISGRTEDSGGLIVRTPGTIRVVGTATSDYGVFNIDVSL